MHLNSTNVKKGYLITEGQTIGTVGGSGYGGQFKQDVHLHYEIRKKNNMTGEYNPIEPAPNKELIDPQEWITPLDKQDNSTANNNDANSKREKTDERDASTPTHELWPGRNAYNQIMYDGLMKSIEMYDFYKKNKSNKK